MNNLNNSNLKDTIDNTLQEILAGDSANCFSILSWKSKKVPDALILKFHGNRYLGLLRKDKKGQDYWRYHPLTPPTELPKSDQVKNHEPNNTNNNSNSEHYH